ncbi:hypothetical protein EYF80_016925 [Liparis tanakae]|uniref:Uncharacterized protein n=1 Tax=Liparis tanakae TaxID=230148 RepID=A0A4Z2I666_9TELE|nr:hypothetical protein EYF80_016925 [Liparis tanakae]
MQIINPTDDKKKCPAILSPKSYSNAASVAKRGRHTGVISAANAVLKSLVERNRRERGTSVEINRGGALPPPFDRLTERAACVDKHGFGVQ